MIFVSYSWIDKEPDMEVLNFVAYLRKNGYEATCDVMYMDEETAISFPKMMAKNLKEADKVIVVLSKDYKEKADLFRGGVGREYNYIIEDICNSFRKYILVTFFFYIESVIPDFLKGREVVSLSSNEESYKKLFYKLSDKKMFHFPEVNSKQCILEPEIVGGVTNFSPLKDEHNRKIYIHHYNKDRDVVLCFINLLIEVFHINSKNIFCKSSDQTGIYYDGFAKVIKNSIKNSDVIFFFITQNYVNNKSYLVELGVAWAYDKIILPLILSPLDYAVLNGTPLQWTQGLLLNDAHKTYNALSDYFIKNNFTNELDTMQEIEALSKTSTFIDYVNNNTQ